MKYDCYDRKEPSAGAGCGANTKARPGAGTEAVIVILAVGLPLFFTLRYVDRFLTMIVFAVTLLAAGIMLLIKSGKARPDKKMLPLAFIVIGAEKLLSELLMLVLADSGTLTQDQLIKLSDGLSFIFGMTVGLSILVLPFVSDRLRRNRCCFPVEAVCLGTSPDPLKGHMSFLPVWEYTVYGAVYKNGNAPWANTGHPQPGDVRGICVDPNSPYDVYSRNYITLGMAVLAGGTIVFLTLFSIL